MILTAMHHWSSWLIASKVRDHCFTIYAAQAKHSILLLALCLAHFTAEIIQQGIQECPGFNSNSEIRQAFKCLAERWSIWKAKGRPYCNLSAL